MQHTGQLITFNKHLMLCQFTWMEIPLKSQQDRHALDSSVLLSNLCSPIKGMQLIFPVLQLIGN